MLEIIFPYNLKYRDGIVIKFESILIKMLPTKVQGTMKV